LLGFSYADAPFGAILAETDTPSSSQAPADYSYDARGRVTSMTPGSGSTLNYGFDASGNLTTLPTGATGTYDHAGELTSSVLSGTTMSYTYNADGEQLSATRGSATLASSTWNGAGELTSYSDATADMSSATYDGDGLRASELSIPSGGSPIMQDFVWNTDSSVPNLLMDSTNAYIFAGSGTPAEQVNLSTGTIVYLVADSLGSVRGAVASSGSLSGSVDYDAWGNPETAGGLSSYTPFGFAGAYTDLSGIVYLIGRYYDPQTGQFLSVDPEVQESLEAFGYAGDDPVDGTDPTGDISCGSPSNCKAILRHNANAKTAFTYFLTIDHFTAAQAAGFVGNFEVESGVNPDCLGGTGVCLPLPSSAPSEPVGIAQWLPPRSTELFAFAADLHVKPSAVPHDLTLQLEFVSDELGIGPFHKDAGWREVAWANSPIRSAPNPASAAENVARYYEGAVAPVTPTNPSGLQDLPDRQHFAEAAYALW
jgi:RHS repeat-associated protein